MWPRANLSKYDPGGSLADAAWLSRRKQYPESVFDVNFMVKLLRARAWMPWL